MGVVQRVVEEDHMHNALSNNALVPVLPMCEGMEYGGMMLVPAGIKRVRKLVNTDRTLRAVQATGVLTTASSDSGITPGRDQTC